MSQNPPHLQPCICVDCEARDTVNRRVELDRRAGMYPKLVESLRELKTSVNLRAAAIVSCAPDPVLEQADRRMWEAVDRAARLLDEADGR